VKRLRRALLLFLILGLIWTPTSNSETQGLIIVATFSSLVPDISLITCPGDFIKGLVPAGIDPHEYMLTPDDVSYLRKADVIVSTAHTHAELQIRELVNSGELNGRLVEVLSVNGVRLSKNPNTGQPNYHSVLYDPLNYLSFTYNLTILFSELNPSMRDCYVSKYIDLYEIVLNTILVHRGKYEITAVADTPLSQYAVEWLGIKIVRLVEAEHDLEASSTDLLEVENLMRERAVGLAIVTYPPTKTSEYLEEQASLYGIPVLRIESPLTNNSFPSRLSMLLSQNITPLETTRTCEVKNRWNNITVTALSAVAGVSGLVIGFSIRGRVRVKSK